MLSNEEIAIQFRKGASKQGIANLLRTQAKTDKQRLSRWDALKRVEQAIIADYHKILGGVTEYVFGGFHFGSYCWRCRSAFMGVK